MQSVRSSNPVFQKMNLRGDALVLLASPRRSLTATIKPQSLAEGDVVLIDGGCKLEGLLFGHHAHGDFGKPSRDAARI